MRGRFLRAAYHMLACLFSTIIIVGSSMPAGAAPEVVRKAGTVRSVMQIIKTAYVPSVSLTEDRTADGSFTVEGSGLKSFPDADKIHIDIWQRADASDLQTFDVEKKDDGSCQAQAGIAEHDYHFGIYHIRLRIGQSGSEIVLAEREAQLSGDNTVYATPADAQKSAAILHIASPNIDGNAVNAVQAVVTSREGGEEDREKLILSRTGDQLWEATVASTAFALDGEFDAKLYAGAVELGSTTFTMVRPAPHKSSKAVALTFDDGPGSETGKLLAQLKKYKSHATFFVTGKNAGRYPDQLKEMRRIGCEIGNHSYDHPQLGNASEEVIKQQLGSTNDIIRKHTGSPATIVRPPYGDIGDPLREYAQAPLILWSIDTLDWKTRNAETTIDTVMSQARDGDIILMHDIHAESVEAALKLIPKLRKKGFELVTVSELATLKSKKLENGLSYRSLK